VSRGAALAKPRPPRITTERAGTPERPGPFLVLATLRRLQRPARLSDLKWNWRPGAGGLTRIELLDDEDAAGVAAGRSKKEVP